LVLVVEDEPLIAMDLEILLQSNGWRVLGPAATVDQALRLLEGGEIPDVALLDANLGGEMVTPVVEQLRAQGIPFVLASAYDGPHLAALGLGGAPQVGKPFHPRRLLTALANALGPPARPGSPHR
jgi:DNA-binding response OmpR family regulator